MSWLLCIQNIWYIRCGRLVCSSVSVGMCIVYRISISCVRINIVMTIEWINTKNMDALEDRVWWDELKRKIGRMLGRETERDRKREEVEGSAQHQRRKKSHMHERSRKLCSDYCKCSTRIRVIFAFFSFFYIVRSSSCCFIFHELNLCKRKPAKICVRID